MELNPLGKKIETICQFGIAPGEAEMIDARKAGSIKSPSDLLGKNLGVPSIGSGTHTLPRIAGVKVWVAEPMEVAPRFLPSRSDGDLIEPALRESITSASPGAMPNW